MKPYRTFFMLLFAVFVIACAHHSRAAYNPKTVVSETASPNPSKVVHYTGTLNNVADSGSTSTDLVHKTGTETISGEKSWTATQTFSEMQAPVTTGMSVRDSTGTTQVFIGSGMPEYPNGLTVAKGETLSVNYYVATTGTSTGDGLSRATAVDSLKTAVKRIPTGYHGDVTINLDNGNYTGLFLSGSPLSSSFKGLYATNYQGSVITIQSLSGNPADVVIDTIPSDGPSGVPAFFSAYGTAWLNIRNLTITHSNAAHTGIVANFGGHVSVTNLVFNFYTGGGYGLKAEGAGSEIYSLSTMVFNGVSNTGTCAAASNAGRIYVTGGTWSANSVNELLYVRMQGMMRVDPTWTIPSTNGNTVTVSSLGSLYFYGALSCTDAPIRFSVSEAGTIDFFNTLNLDGTDSTTAFTLASGGTVVFYSACTLNDFFRGVAVSDGAKAIFRSASTISSCSTGVEATYGGRALFSAIPTMTGNTTDYSVAGPWSMAGPFIAGGPFYGLGTGCFYIGPNCGKGATTGANYNVAVGPEAFSGVKTTGANGNSSFGYQAGLSVTSGANNTFLGYRSGRLVDTGGGNTAVGADTILRGYYNTAVGAFALSSCSSAANGNLALGPYSLSNNTTGDYNIAQGYYAGRTNTTESNRWYVGGWDGSTQYPITPWWETPAVTNNSIDIYINRTQYKLPLMTTSFELGIRVIKYTDGMADAISIDPSGNTTFGGVVSYSQGVQYRSIDTITTTTTIDLAGSKFLVDASANYIEITLPDASDETKGATFWFKASTDPGTNVISFTTVGGTQTIDGDQIKTGLLNTQYDSFEVTNDGSNWYLW